MAKLPVITLPDTKKASQTEVSESIFGLSLRKDLLNEYVLMQRRAARQGTHSTKTRSEVAGTTKKPFRQKGTGHARQGSLKGPHQYGGGVAFGPKPREYGMKLNRKQKKETLRVALSEILYKEKLLVTEKFEVASGKTKDATALLKPFFGKKVLLIGEFSEETARSIRNITGVKMLPVTALNVRDLLLSQHIIMTKEALGWIEENMKPESREKAA